MTTGNRPQSATPPYVSYRSWETFLSHLKTNLMPVPDRLDTSVWKQSPFSGSTKSGIQGALLFLGLIDSSAGTLGRLTNLAEADTQESQQRILRSLFDERYSPILEEVDPARATRQQIQDKFRKAGCANATAEKAVSFFVNFARDAGIDVHSALFRNNQGTRTRRKNVVSRKIQPDESENIVELPKTEIVAENTDLLPMNDAHAVDGAHPVLRGLLDLLPRNGRSWTNAEREKVKLAFGTLLDLAYPTIDDADRRMF